MSAITKHLESVGIDMNLLWSKIYDVIIKTFLSVDSHISQGIKKLASRSNCFELFGFDILIDQDLKPWVIEVNLSPSLATESPLDLKIKSSLFVDALNLIGIRKPDKRRDNITKMKNRVKNIMRAKSYNSRQGGPQTKGVSNEGAPEKLAAAAKGDEYFNSNKLLIDRVGTLNGRNKDILRESLHEYFRKGNFLRIYPSVNSDIYDKYFLQQK